MAVRAARIAQWLMLALPYLQVGYTVGYVGVVARVLRDTASSPAMLLIAALMLAYPLAQLAGLLSRRWRLLHRYIETLLSSAIIAASTYPSILPIIFPVAIPPNPVSILRSFLASVFSLGAIILSFLPIVLSIDQLRSTVEGDFRDSVIKTVEIHVALTLVALAEKIPDPSWATYLGRLAAYGARYGVAIAYLHGMLAWILLRAQSFQPISTWLVNALRGLAPLLRIHPLAGVLYILSSYSLLKTPEVDLGEFAQTFLAAAVASVALLAALSMSSTLALGSDLASGLAPFIVLAVLSLMVRGAVRR